MFLRTFSFCRSGTAPKKEGEIVRAKNTGFTIVELLIVIVVIGVLAAISVVAYTGITQKANNAAIISAANQTLKAIQAYMAAKDDYPTKTEVCITVDSGCAKSGGQTVSSNSAFNTAMAGVAKPPTRVPNSGTTAYGIYTNYSSTRTYNGDHRPLVFTYFFTGYFPTVRHRSDYFERRYHVNINSRLYKRGYQLLR